MTDRERNLRTSRRTSIRLAVSWFLLWLKQLFSYLLMSRDSKWSYRVSRFVGDELNDPDINLE